VLSARSKHHYRHLLEHFRVDCIGLELVIFFSVAEDVASAKTPRINLVGLAFLLYFQSITLAACSIDRGDFLSLLWIVFRPQALH